MDIEGIKKAFATFHFTRGLELQLELEPGAPDVHECIAAAKQTAALMRHVTLSFDFNEVLIRVNEYTDVDALVDEFLRTPSGRVIGPRPDADLTEEERALNTRLEAAQKLLQEEKDAAREARKRSAEAES